MIVPRLASRHCVKSDKINGPLHQKVLEFMARDEQENAAKFRATGRCLILHRQYAPVEMG